MLRNLDASKGLCNGTRLRVSQIRRKVLKCRIISGDAKFAGNVVFIPRITLALLAEDSPLPLRRRKFPVQLAFAMIVNKSQGQSLKHVGLDLWSPVFSHGQLYVGLLRHDRGKGIPLCFWVKGMRGKGRGLEVHTPAYPCTLTKGIQVCRGMAYIRISYSFPGIEVYTQDFHQLNSDLEIV